MHILAHRDGKGIQRVIESQIRIRGYCQKIYEGYILCDM